MSFLSGRLNGIKGKDETFITRPERKPTRFELKYLEMFGNDLDKRIGLPGLSPQLMDKKREMEEVDKQLKEARANFKTWEANLEVKKREIEDKKERLTEKKKNLDNFALLHNTDLKRYRDREQSELQQVELMEQELDKLNKEENELLEKNEELVAELKTLQPCSNYLQGVVESCRRFDSIESVLNRYSMLSSTRHEYLSKFQRILRNLGEEERVAMERLLQEKNLLIDATMAYNDKLQNADYLKREVAYRKTDAVKDIQRSELKNVELSMIKTSIKTIYNRAVSKSITCKSEHMDKIEENTEESMLEFIQNRFTDLSGIIDEWRREHPAKN